MENYSDFVVHKSERAVHTDSIVLTVDDLNDKLYDFQKDIVRWALAKGRAAIFADCGLGKTAMQLEWAHRVCVHTGGNALIVAPLTVSPQTVGEGLKFGVPVTLCETADDIQPGVNIANYEKLDKFAGVHFSAVVLDESSILKSFTGKVRNQIIDFFSDTPFRLACTAYQGIEAAATSEYRARFDAIAALIHTVKYICGLAGFEVVGRITLRHKQSGDIYK